MDVLRTEFPKTDRAFPLGDPASRAGPRPRSLPPDSEAALPATQAPDRTSEPVRRRALTFPKTAPNTARAVTPGLGGRPSHARRQDYSLPVRKNPPRLERPPEVPRCLQTCHAPFVPRGMSISWPTVGVRRRRPTFSPDPPCVRLRAQRPRLLSRAADDLRQIYHGKISKKHNMPSRHSHETFDGKSVRVGIRRRARGQLR
jgi:hypothetical protein